MKMQRWHGRLARGFGLATHGRDAGPRFSEQAR